MNVALLISIFALELISTFNPPPQFLAKQFLNSNYPVILILLPDPEDNIYNPPPSLKSVLLQSLNRQDPVIVSYPTL